MKATLGAVLGALLLVTKTAVAADPVVGTWELNVAKSKFNSALNPAPKSETRTYSESADGVTAVTIKTVGANGKEETLSLSFKVDGKDYPVNDPQADTITEKRIDSHTVEYSEKKAGKTRLQGQRTVSQDGNTLTVSDTWTDKSGVKISQTMVYDKR